MTFSIAQLIALALCLCSLLARVGSVDANSIHISYCEAKDCIAYVSGSKTIKNKNFRGRAKECVEKITATTADWYNVHDYVPGKDITGDYLSMINVDVKGLRQTKYGTIFPYKGVTCYVDCSVQCPHTSNGAVWERSQEFRAPDTPDKLKVKRIAGKRLKDVPEQGQ